jgi:ABC-2 type transport system permease protein
MIPLDLYPEPLKTWMIRSPFAAGVYVPVGYITGRFDSRLVWETFVSITIGLVVVGLVARVAWRMGLRSYTGTGA